MNRLIASWIRICQSPTRTLGVQAPFVAAELHGARHAASISGRPTGRASELRHLRQFFELRDLNVILELIPLEILADVLRVNNGPQLLGV